MMIKRHIATVAAIAGCTIGLAAPAMAATSATTRPSTPASIPAGLQPFSTDWVTPQRGIVLGYRKRATGAKPYLIATGNGGKTWQSLPAPAVPFPADQDQPSVTWEDGDIAATDGTHVYVTANAGQHWTAERLAGLSGSFFVANLDVADGRVFALVTTSTSAGVYAGRPASGVLRAVPGLSIKGSGDSAYGDLTTVGGPLQVDLGSNYTAEKYWYSRNGVRFTAAKLPCPDSTFAMLGGVRGGKVIALCNGSPSDIGLGQNDKQVFIAPKLGAAFKSSGPVFDSSNTLDFAAATASAMTLVTTFAPYSSLNAGKTWAARIPQNNGAGWYGLTFPSATTGYVVCNTYNNELKPVDTLYRTANDGRSWQAIRLP
jgi:hypothetical protein